MKKNLFTMSLIVLIIIAVAISAYLVFGQEKNETSQINTFAECVEAGYSLLHGHTASEAIYYECTTPDGRTFTEIIE